MFTFSIQDFPGRKKRNSDINNHNVSFTIIYWTTKINIFHDDNNNSEDILRSCAAGFVEDLFVLRWTAPLNQKGFRAVSQNVSEEVDLQIKIYAEGRNLLINLPLIIMNWMAA